MAAHPVSATQAKFIHSRIDNVEEHFGLMCASFEKLARKNAKCRDSIDDFARIIVAYADTETLNRSMRTQTTHFADTLCGVADLQEALVQKLETRIVSGFTAYKIACEHARDDLTTSFKAQGRESKSGKKLQAVREKSPGNVKQVSQAEASLQKAIFDVARTHAALEESIAYFEMKKLRDFRRLLMEFCYANLSFHVKGLELYTYCYNMIDDIHIDNDVEEFKRALMFPSGNLQYRTPEMMPNSLMNFGAPNRPSGAGLGMDMGRGGYGARGARNTLTVPGQGRSPPYSRSQSLDRNYGSRRSSSEPRERYQHSHSIQYSAQSRGYGDPYGQGPRASRSRST